MPDRRVIRAPAPGGWRDYRPAIWTALVGVAVVALVSPWPVSIFFFGAAIGIGLRVRQRHRRARGR